MVLYKALTPVTAEPIALGCVRVCRSSLRETQIAAGWVIARRYKQDPCVNRGVEKVLI